MTQHFQAIPERQGVDEKIFREEILQERRPVVMRGLVKHWPAVAHGRRSPGAIAEYLKGFDSGAPVNAIMTKPEVKGRVFYRDDMSGFNFVRNRLPISAVIDQLMRYSTGQNPPCVAVQSALIAPRIWIGNTITVPAHVDDADNIACVIAGRRRFTLFPPEQVANMYIGPLEFNPAGAPISMVPAHDRDLQRFPKFGKALDAAMVSELEPGDALFIPSVWWHQVESLGVMNILINYWWGGSIGTNDRTNGPIDCLLHCLLNMKDLPAATRRAWGEIFKHYVFEADYANFDYIPDSRKGVLGKLDAEQIESIKKGLIDKLSKAE